MYELIGHEEVVLGEVDGADVQEVAEGDGEIVNFVALEAIFEVQGSEGIRRTI